MSAVELTTTSEAPGETPPPKKTGVADQTAPMNTVISDTIVYAALADSPAATPAEIASPEQINAAPMHEESPLSASSMLSLCYSEFAPPAAAENDRMQTNATVEDDAEVPLSITMVEEPPVERKVVVRHERSPSPMARRASPVPGNEAEPAVESGEDDEDDGAEKPTPPRTYMALDDETPLLISEKLGIPVKRIVDINKKVYKGLRNKSKLKENTKILLPNLDGTDPVIVTPEDEAKQREIKCETGEKIEVKSKGEETWYAAVILRKKKKSIQVHFEGWPREHDEWIPGKQIALRARKRGKKKDLKYGPNWKDGKEIEPKAEAEASDAAQAGKGHETTGAGVDGAGAGPASSTGKVAGAAAADRRKRDAPEEEEYELVDRDAFTVVAPRPAAVYLGADTDRIVDFPDELSEMLHTFGDLDEFLASLPADPRESAPAAAGGVACRFARPGAGQASSAVAAATASTSDGVDGGGGGCGGPETSEDDDEDEEEEEELLEIRRRRYLVDKLLVKSFGRTARQKAKVTERAPTDLFDSYAKQVAKAGAAPTPRQQIVAERRNAARAKLIDLASWIFDADDSKRPFFEPRPRKRLKPTPPKPAAPPALTLEELDEDGGVEDLMRGDEWRRFWTGPVEGEGEAYYHNSRTDETTWEEPLEWVPGEWEESEEEEDDEQARLSGEEEYEGGSGLRFTMELKLVSSSVASAASSAYASASGFARPNAKVLSRAHRLSQGDPSPCDPSPRTEREASSRVRPELPTPGGPLTQPLREAAEVLDGRDGPRLLSDGGAQVLTLSPAAKDAELMPSPAGRAPAAAAAAGARPDGGGPAVSGIGSWPSIFVAMPDAPERIMWWLEHCLPPVEQSQPAAGSGADEKKAKKRKSSARLGPTPALGGIARLLSAQARLLSPGGAMVIPMLTH
eukprot:SAG11_NODE_645_length_7983_cov_5.727596_1_plen_913_part_00